MAILNPTNRQPGWFVNEDGSACWFGYVAINKDSNEIVDGKPLYKAIGQYRRVDSHIVDYWNPALIFETKEEAEEYCKMAIEMKKELGREARWWEVMK